MVFKKGFVSSWSIPPPMARACDTRSFSVLTYNDIPTIRGSLESQFPSVGGQSPVQASWDEALRGFPDMVCLCNIYAYFRPFLSAARILPTPYPLPAPERTVTFLTVPVSPEHRVCLSVLSSGGFPTFHRLQRAGRQPGSLLNLTDLHRHKG